MLLPGPGIEYIKGVGLFDLISFNSSSISFEISLLTRTRPTSFVFKDKFTHPILLQRILQWVVQH